MILPLEDREAAAPAYILRGALITDGDCTPGCVVAVNGGLIAYAGPGDGFDAAHFPGAEELPLPPGSSLLPGLVDLHCHGAAGGGFPAGNDRACRAAVDFLHRNGTTSLLASLVTAPEDELVGSLGVLKVLAAEGRLVCPPTSSSSTFSPRNTARARRVSARTSSHMAANCPSEMSM